MVKFYVYGNSIDITLRDNDGKEHWNSTHNFAYKQDLNFWLNSLRATNKKRGIKDEVIKGEYHD